MPQFTLRILHVVTSMDLGGLETLVMNLYRNIDRDKVQFDFLTHRTNEGYFDKEIQALGGRMYHVPPINPLHHLKYLLALKRFFREHTEYRIVHAHNNAFSMYVLREAKRAGIPVCIDHSHIAHYPFEFPKSLFYDYCRLRINAYCDYCFSCSQAAGQWLFGEKIIDDPNFRVIHNAIDVEKFQHDDDTRQRVRQALCLVDKFVVGHVGRFDIQKNHAFLIDIFKELHVVNPNARLLLIGKGQLEGDIRRKVDELGLSDVVIFLGLRSDVNELMQAMDAFVFPSLYEGLGIVAVEAQAAGLPCFISADVVPKEVEVTDSVAFTPLMATAKDWSNQILSRTEGFIRKVAMDRVRAAGYDIALEAKKLESYYLLEGKEM